MLALRGMFDMIPPMNSETDPLPPPEYLEQQASEAPRIVNLWDYLKTMKILRERGYSYQKVADWINERLDADVTRNQVAYTLNAPHEVLADEKEDEENEHLADEAMERDLQPEPVPTPSVKAPRQRKKAKS
jgi:hypothetical protein